MIGLCGKARVDEDRLVTMTVSQMPKLPFHKGVKIHIPSNIVCVNVMKIPFGEETHEEHE